MPQGFSGKGYRDASMDCDIERRASSIMLAGPDVIAPYIFWCSYCIDK